jgi:hypothetical protein
MKYLLVSIAIVIALSAWVRPAQASFLVNAPRALGLHNGLVGYWTFDGKDISGVQAYDRSGNGNRGTLTNGPTLVNGKLGQGMEFDGSNDYVDLTSKNGFSTGSGASWTLAAWAKTDILNSNYHFIVGYGDGTSGTSPHIQLDNLNNWQTSTYANDLSGPPAVKGRWTHVVGVGSGTTLRLYIDGQQYASAEVTNAPVTTRARIGTDMGASPNLFFDGLLDDVRIYTRALSADEIKRLYKIGATAKVNVSLNGPTNGLIGHWTFDGKDMAGVKAYDRSGQGKNGTLTGDAARAAGKISQGVSFDGNGDYVSVGNAGSGVKTISFWVKANLGAGSSASFTNTYSSAGTFTWNASTTASTIQVEAWGGGGAGGGNTQNTDGGGGGGGGAYAKETAYAIVQNNDYTVQVGSGGTAVANGSGGAGGQSLFVNTSTLLASGGDGGGMASSSAPGVGGDGGTGVGDVTFTGGAGGAGRDNNTGTGGGGGEGACSTGTGNAGTAGGGSPGSGGSGCDGGDGGGGGAQNANGDPSSTPGGAGGGSGEDNGAGDRSGGAGADGKVIITWTESTPATDDFKLIDIDGTDQIEIIDNAIVATSFPAATVYVDGQKETTVDGQWHHVVIVDTSGVNASAMNIGRVSSSYLNGLLDDVRIYNRELSRDEINRLYKVGATFKVNTTQTTDSLQRGLVGHWTFDGKHMSGVHAYDASGNGNRGVLTNGPVRATGKIGQGMQFDGVDDYVALPSIAFDNRSFTVAAWVKPTITNDSIYFSVHSNNAPNEAIHLRISTNGSLRFGYYADDLDTAAGVVSLNTWSHITMSYDASLDKSSIFVNGQFITSGSQGPFIGTNPIVAIGYWTFSGVYYKGPLDDVRVYNRALSADEIKRLYNMGR